MDSQPRNTDTRRYRDIYPSAPEKRSDDLVRPSAASLLTVESFSAAPASMPTEVFEEHHVLINLKEEPHRVENWRDGEHRDFQFHRNEVVVTPAGIESGWKWHATSKCIVVTLKPDQLETFTKHELGVLLTGRQLQDIPQFLDEDLARAGEMLLEALESPLGSDVMFESFARVFLVKLVQRYGQKASEQEPRFSPAFTSAQFQRVLAYVSEHFKKEVRLEDMAAQAAISPSHFSRLFKKTIGESPHQFLLSYRVEQAKRLLRKNHQTIIGVALACGFSDQAHMTRVFRKRLGMTPRQWRISDGS